MVEDDVILQALARKVLVRAGYEVVLAGTGPDGVEAALSGAADLMLLDLRLPGIDGWEVARQVRAARSSMPILACSANMMPGDKERAREAGADAFLGKPYSPTELLEAVGRFVTPSVAAASERAGDVIDQQSPGGFGAGRILVVDDEDDNRALLRKVLTIAGFEISEAGSGEEALRLMRDWGPEAVLLDLMMPGMGGYDVLRVKSRQVDIATIPVLVLSALIDIPAKVEGLELGAIDYLSKPFDRLELLARVKGAIRRQREQVDLKQANSELARLAAFDALTGLANGRLFEVYWEREVARHIRYGTPLALVMFDIDHFKATNEDYGHAVGDEFIRQLAKTLKGTVRLTDVLARVGGEEFALAMVNCNTAGAITAAERLFSRAAAVQVFPMSRGCTISAGVATTADTPVGELLGAAAEALSLAKRQGRNRVEAAAPPALAHR